MSGNAQKPEQVAEEKKKQLRLEIQEAELDVIGGLHGVIQRRAELLQKMKNKFSIEKQDYQNCIEISVDSCYSRLKKLVCSSHRSR